MCNHFFQLVFCIIKMCWFCDENRWVFFSSWIFSFWLRTVVSMSFPLSSHLVIANFIMDKQKIIDRKKRCSTRKLRPTNRILWSSSSSPPPPPISSTFIAFFFIIHTLWPTNWNDGYYKWVLATAGKHKLDNNLCYFALKNHLRNAPHTINRRRNDDDVMRVCVCMCLLCAEWDSPCHMSCNARIHVPTKNDKPTRGKSKRCYACIYTQYNCRFRFSLDLYVTLLLCFSLPSWFAFIFMFAQWKHPFNCVIW